MDIIEIIAWLVVSIVGVGIVGVYLSRSPKGPPVDIELQKLRSPSPEAVAKVKARDEELARTRSANIVTVSDDVEIELQKLRSPSSEAVAKVKARDEELARTRSANIVTASDDVEIELQKLRSPSSEAKPTIPNNTNYKNLYRKNQKSIQKPLKIELNEPTEKLTMENMNPDTKKMLTEFLMYPTKDYVGLSHLLSTYNTDSKLRSYLSSRIGLRKAKRKTFYD